MYCNPTKIFKSSLISAWLSICRLQLLWNHGGEEGGGGTGRAESAAGGEGWQEEGDGQGRTVRDSFALLCGGKWNFLNIPSKKQQFGDTDVTKSPQWARMANRGRLRPADTILPEYLENPFPEAGTKNHSIPFPLSAPPVPAFLCPAPAAPFHPAALPNWQNSFLYLSLYLCIFPCSSMKSLVYLSKECYNKF